MIQIPMLITAVLVICAVIILYTWWQERRTNQTLDGHLVDSNALLLIGLTALAFILVVIFIILLLGYD